MPDDFLASPPKKLLPSKPTALRHAAKPAPVAKDDDSSDDGLELFRRSKEMAPVVAADRERRLKRKQKQRELEEQRQAERRMSDSGKRHLEDEQPDGPSSSGGPRSDDPETQEAELVITEVLGTEFKALGGDEAPQNILPTVEGDQKLNRRSRNRRQSQSESSAPGQAAESPKPRKRGRNPKKQPKEQKAAGQQEEPDEDNLPKDPRRRRILERNRIAATKSRLRKRDEASALASRGQAMEAQNRYLSTCFDSLTSEIYNLKTQLLQHTDCNCVAIQQYIANEAKKTVVGLLSCSPAFQLENDSMSPDNGSSSGPSIADSLNMHSLEAGSFPPIWTNPVQRGHRASENLIPPSDSGYGSVLNSGKSTHILDVGCETRNLSRAALGAPVEKRENEAEVDDTLDAMDDCNTVYTDNMTISHVRLESYMTALVDDLFQKIGNLFQDPEVVEQLAAALPRVLKAFSCKLGYAGSSQMHRDVMVFIHKYRGTMTEMFRERYADAMDARQNLNRRRDPPLMLSRWPASQDDSDYENLPEQSWETSPGNEFEEDHELSVPGLEEYKHMIYNAPSYEWVLGQLRREVLLSKPKKSNVMDAIRERVLGAIPGKRHVSRKAAPQAVQVTYAVDYDLLTFLRGQEYDEPADEAIAGAVTLTGSQADAQASSCQQYLEQAWPCTGSQTLMLIQKMLRNPDYDAQVFVSEPSACKVTASLDDGKLVISASGIPEFVAEIGEQVAWMGAALQLSPYANNVVTECTPFVEDIRPVEDVLHCRIKFDFRPCREQFGVINGQCWHDMFHSAVIARGFPILRRPETNTGLEMPLDLMTLLTRTRYVDEFGLRMYIKGFSTMLIPTKRSDGMIYWHLLFNKNPEERISYLDCRTEHATVQKADLEASRHVLGWCSDAVSTVGTLMANYSISRSQLPLAHSGCALDKVEIHAGQLVTGTACFSLGNREKPVHISRDGYFTKLQWISSKWIVFWDEGEKRGWLVNGASALLHILRASLTHSKRKFKSAFLMNPQDLLDLEDAMVADAALQLLTDEKNRSLLLYRENVEFENPNTDLGKVKEPATRFRYYRLENRVDHIYNMLEKLIDHQTDVEQRSGLRIHPRPRRHLEGWDFKDLVTDGDPFFARVATLNALGKGWVDFIRSIHAVALFGRGFGELIQPKGTSNGGCPRWLKLPAERYYLAACVSDLREIMEDHGDAQLNPMKLCDNVLWLVKHAAFQSCPCGTTTQSLKHYEPVQALFPMTFKHLLRKKPLAELQEAGAVVFGHNINIHWHWKDFGDPVKGDPPEEGSSSDSFEDSGLGSSLGSYGSPSSSDTVQALSSASHTASTGASDPSGCWTHGDQQILTPAGPSRGRKRRVQGVISSITKKVKPSR
ncbi:hypothetical protein MRS44_018307 [Fusarium solani]|uniref:uncharacterized protein n=1 Tax=Fusarium solani TaxID=169388 RepID=UPI0032C420BD|nr:hypothetical protein MRS44_018307 [Fusarium solani]